MTDIEDILWEMFNEERGQFGASGSPTRIAEVLTEKLTSDETILRALNAEEPRAATDNLADWGERSIARMRRALAAAIGGDDE